MPNEREPILDNTRRGISENVDESNSSQAIPDTGAITTHSLAARVMHQFTQPNDDARDRDKPACDDRIHVYSSIAQKPERMRISQLAGEPSSTMIGRIGFAPGHRVAR